MRTANWATLMTGALLLTSVARADDVTIRRDTVVPVVFNETIDGGKARVGDLFTAHVDGGRDLPRGTDLRGRIERISKQEGNTVLTMRFRELRLPDGGRYAIEAIPVALDSKLLSKTPDGRITARRDDRSRVTKVFGGLVGGLAVGSIFGKAKEGAILGTIIGAGAALGDKASGQEIAVKKGQRYGAMFDRAVTLNVAGRISGRDPYDAIRNPSSTRNDPPRNEPVRDTDPYRDRDADRRDEPRLYRDGKELTFEDARPIREDGTLWLPVRETARLLGLKFEDESTKDADGKVIEAYSIEGNDRILELDADRERIRLDGRRQDDLKILRRDGMIYLPLSAFSPLVQERLTSDGDKDDAGLPAQS